MLESHPEIYNSIGAGYCNSRVPDPRIAMAIHRALGDAETVCNVGAGAGAYEPVDRQLTAVEPSQKMIAQRRSTAEVICASAEELPFDDGQFDAAMATLTVHHWQDPQRGLSEMRRVSRRQVILTFDADMIDALWFVRDYLPEIIEFEKGRAFPIQQFSNVLNVVQTIPILVPHDCTDGFQGAFWRRPEQYLRPEIRAAISTLAQLPRDLVERAVAQLDADLSSGRWHQEYAALLHEESIDLGYRLIVAENEYLVSWHC